MRTPFADSNHVASGFSVMELLIALTICLAVLAGASALLARSLRTRTRENTRSEALAAAQRAVNLMSREIGNSGYGLTDNGLVASDSGSTSIRVRANLNNNATLDEPDEDVRYVYQPASRAIVRFDACPAPTGHSTVMAAGIDNLTLTYWDIDGTQITDAGNYGAAERITMDVRVDLPAGPDQPAGVVRLVSDIALRNAPNTLARF